MSKREPIKHLEELQEGRFYRVNDLKAILEDLGLNYSIFSIMNAETWKCLNYECGKRYKDKVTKCTKCGSPVSEPIIPSPRTRGGGKGIGHRRYSADDIRKVVAAFQQ